MRLDECLYGRRLAARLAMPDYGVVADAAAGTAEFRDRRPSGEPPLRCCHSRTGVGSDALGGKGSAEVGRRGDTGAVVDVSIPAADCGDETLLGDPSKAKDKLGWIPTTPLKNLLLRWWLLM